MVRRLPLRLLPMVLVCLLTCAGRAAAADQTERPIVLLVNGIVEDQTKLSQVWGQILPAEGKQPARWNGMVGFLDAAGYRFGGTIRARRSALSLPRDLDVQGVRVAPAVADCFWLQFTENAATDGIAAKAMELAGAIARLREFTGRSKVYLVTHSAGGLVARAYVQSAFPDALGFRHDVDRLITIAAPHLGSALAEHWGDWLGTRATSLKTTATLLTDLNEHLDLPADVCFASIVVRGIWTDTDGAGADYDRLVDREFVETLPIDFREGGDQVLSVRTQNLRLAHCAARYEASTGRAVQYLVARVRKDSQEMIHTVALRDRQVQQWVRLLLDDDGQCWQGFASDARRTRWVDQQAASCTFSLLEEQTRQQHWCGGLECGQLRVACAGSDGSELRYCYQGQATWRRHKIGLFSHQNSLTGGIRLTTDSFGRVRGCQLDPELVSSVELDRSSVAATEF